MFMCILKINAHVDNRIIFQIYISILIINDIQAFKPKNIMYHIYIETYGIDVVAALGFF